MRKTSGCIEFGHRAGLRVYNRIVSKARPLVAWDAPLLSGPVKVQLACMELTKRANVCLCNSRIAKHPYVHTANGYNKLIRATVTPANAALRK